MDNDKMFDTITQTLSPRFRGVFAPETIKRVVAETYSMLAESAKITTYLSIFTERFARDRLDAMTKLEGASGSEVPEVLFVCVHNAGRSQMAAALLDHHAKGRVKVRSAGSAPASELNPAVIAAMDEIGIDVSKEFPKPLTDEIARAADVLITMGCGDACPVFPGKRYLDWELPDPAGKTVAEVRPIRDEIERRVTALLAELTAAPVGPAAG